MAARCEIAQPGFPKVGNRCPGFLYNPRNTLDRALTLNLETAPVVRTVDIELGFDAAVVYARK